MKSPSRTHHSRITVDSVQLSQYAENFEVRVVFLFDPWMEPGVMPAGYAADALTTFQRVWDAGIEALDREVARELTELREALAPSQETAPEETK